MNKEKYVFQIMGPLKTDQTFTESGVLETPEAENFLS